MISFYRCEYALFLSFLLLYDYQIKCSECSDKDQLATIIIVQYRCTFQYHLDHHDHSHRNIRFTFNEKIAIENKDEN